MSVPPPFAVSQDLIVLPSLTGNAQTPVRSHGRFGLRRIRTVEERAEVIHISSGMVNVRNGWQRTSMVETTKHKHNSARFEDKLS